MKSKQRHTDKTATSSVPTRLVLLFLLHVVVGTPVSTAAPNVKDNLRHRLETVTCESSDDCLESQYCAAGTCLDFAFCNIEEDCYNPSNEVAFIDCVGPVFCSADGMCGKNCTTGDGTGVSCYSPVCDEDTRALGCDEATVCLQDRCADDDPIFMDDAGYIVCNSPDVDNSGTGDLGLCQHNGECDEATQYCASGECLEFAACHTDRDCYNPLNAVGDDCLQNLSGRYTCQDSTCTCIPGEICPNGTEVAFCFASPCSQVTDCDEIVNCVDVYCGGCDTLTFDAAGNEACTGNTDGVPDIIGEGSEPIGDSDPVPVQSLGDCREDSDCGQVSAIGRVSFTGSNSDLYCAQGKCLKTGTCLEDLDCWNPASGINDLPFDDCIGYKECSNEGRCDHICSETCKDGREFAECPVPPCSAETDPCQDSFVCVNQNCGECSTLHFGFDGSQVCTEDTTDQPRAVDCTSNDVCGDGRYCAAGKCLDHSFCRVDIDCLNPANLFAEVECEGYLECGDDGTCQKICGSPDGGQSCCYGSTPCKDGDETGFSIDNDCNDAVICLKDNCNGDDCVPLFLDGQGKQLCKPASQRSDGSRSAHVSMVGSLEILQYLTLMSICILFSVY